MKNLPHVKVKIRESDIWEFDPCTPGMKFFEKFLPATISTEPENNIDLACELLREYHDPEHAGCYRTPLSNVRWFMAKLVEALDRQCPYAPYFHDYLTFPDARNTVPREWLDADGTYRGNPVSVNDKGELETGEFITYHDDPCILAQNLAHIAHLVDLLRRARKKKKGRS